MANTLINSVGPVQNEVLPPTPRCAAWPSWRYHAIHAARVFKSQEELDAAGEGWADSPAKVGTAEAPSFEMSRNRMFAVLKERGVKVSLPVSNDELRAKVAATV